MKDLQKYIRDYMSFFTSDCKFFKQSGFCKNEHGCYCKAISEVCAYTKFILPEEFVHKTIFDFSGASNNNDVIQDDPIASSEFDLFAQQAKEKIYEYCWKGKCPGNNIQRMNPQDMDLISLMDERFKNASNLIIHGNNYIEKFDSKIKKNKKIRIQTGKSMLAAIVLKEAIRRKLFSTNEAFTYQYVSFPILRNNLLDKNDKDKKDYISDLSDIDWLVIDDILLDGDSSNDYKQYFKRQFDAFLMSRLENNKPTIFVMQFNIDNVDLKEDFGFAMDKIRYLKSSFIVRV